MTQDIQMIIDREVSRRVKEEIDRQGLLIPWDELRRLRVIFGKDVTDPRELVERVVRLGRIAVQGREFFLTEGQIKRLREQAFFHRKDGEPATLEEASEEEARKILDRYVDEQLDYYTNAMIGEI